ATCCTCRAFNDGPPQDTPNTWNTLTVTCSTASRHRAGTAPSKSERACTSWQPDRQYRTWNCPPRRTPTPRDRASRESSGYTCTAPSGAAQHTGEREAHVSYLNPPTDCSEGPGAITA